MDGKTVTVEVRWSIFRQDWRVSLYDQDGNRIVSRALVGSPDPVATAAVVWNSAAARVEITTVAAHGLAPGDVAEWTLRNVSPIGFNGADAMRALSPTVLAYDQSASPGAAAATVQGVVGCDIDLAAGYFNTSTLVFRASSRQFEVGP